MSLLLALRRVPDASLSLRLHSIQPELQVSCSATNVDASPSELFARGNHRFRRSTPSWSAGARLLLVLMPPTPAVVFRFS
jgi:hypothetical protein